jgi:hypothetical protein
MVKRKITKGKTIIYKTLHGKISLCQVTCLHDFGSVLWCTLRFSCFAFTLICFVGGSCFIYLSCFFYNGQTKNNKRKNNNLQNITRKNKERATRIPLKCGNELRFPERLAVPAPIVIPVVLLLNDNNTIWNGNLMYATIFVLRFYSHLFCRGFMFYLS